MELQSFEYYSKASIKAIDSYLRFTDFILDNFEEIDNASIQPLFNLFSQLIIPDLRYIQRSSTKNIPWNIIPSLEEILKNEKGNQYLLLIRPQWHFNYSVITEDINTFLRDSILIPLFPNKKNDINNLFEKKLKIHIFSFPHIDKDNVLLHTIIGHEIGHFFHSDWENSTEGNELFEDANIQFTEYYLSISEDILEPYDRAEKGMKTLRGMYREIFSDIIGYKIFGPSMIFVLYYIYKTYESDVVLPSDENNYYPPIKYRIRILVEHFLEDDSEINKFYEETSEAAKTFKLFFDEIKQELKQESDTQNLANGFPVELRFFEKNIDRIKERINNQIGNSYFETRHCEHLFLKLKELLPINEANQTPINMVNILFTGWLYYYKLQSDHYSNDEYNNQFGILLRLLQKSIHSSYIHTKYLEHGERDNINEHINKK